MHMLFPPLNAELRRALELLPRALDAAMPLNAAHRRDLPLAVEELSTRLTCDRSSLHKPYWSAPRLTSAYLRYFLPWNILRLTRLFSGLELPEPLPRAAHDGDVPLPRLLVDIGSGPLSVPLALWLARPRWRALPLTVLCLDAAPRPLELGRRIFLSVAGPDAPWRIVTRRASADAFLREIRDMPGVPWLLTAANVLNELKARPGREEDDRTAGIVEQAAHLLSAPDSRALFVEPGTRLGGKTIVALRETAPEEGLFPEQPCPHGNACPLQGSRTWCHFTFDAAGAPGWLTALSQDARLHKDALSLAFALLRPMPEQPDARETPGARVISAPFSVPGLPGMARYACTARGLAMLADSAACPSGALADVTWPREPGKDRKSGAWILMPQDYEGPRTPEPGTAPSRPARPAAARSPAPRRAKTPSRPGARPDTKKARQHAEPKKRRKR